MKGLNAASLGTTILRVTIGAIFVAHALQKLFVYGLAETAAFLAEHGIPWPGLMTPVVIATELGGGLLLVVGLFTRWASIPLAFTMLVAVATVHIRHGFFLPNGYEFNVALVAGLVTLMLQGSGAWALDHVVARTGRRGPAHP